MTNYNAGKSVFNVLEAFLFLCPQVSSVYLQGISKVTGFFEQRLKKLKAIEMLG